MQMKFTNDQGIMQLPLYDQIQETAQYLQNRVEGFRPQIGIILGTGLSGLAARIERVAEIPYEEIPNFPVSTVKGHAGKMVLGYLAGKAVVALAGRFHYYEGYTMRQVTFPVRVLKALGINRLIISAAVGGVNADMEMGDVVIIRDHINMQPENPLRGENDERLGVRFPDMLNAYDKVLNAKALKLAQAMDLRAHLGVYVATAGPNLETPAEYQFFHHIGGDVVGMSTVPEVLVAKHSELPIFVVSVVSNKCYPPSEIRETSAEDVIEAVERVTPKLTEWIVKVMEELL